LSKPLIQHCFEFLSHFSLRFQYRVADWAAFILRNTSNQLSRQVRANIKLCFADLDKTGQQNLYQESIRQTCYAMTELAAVWCWPVEKILSRVTSIEVCEEFDRSTRGRIILAPHLGSWETLAIWLGKSCSPMMMYRRRKNKAVDSFVKDARARSGGTPVPTKKHGLRKLLIGLKEGGSLMILPDQQPARSKVKIEAEFFGVSAPTTTLVQNLSRKVDCDVFLAHMKRSSPPGEFSLSIQPLEHERLAADETSSAQYMNDQIEQLVRQSLEQYQWGYRRFSNNAYASVK
jgi:KDO2-lipid IV(A) lauroyltransferase